MQAVAYVERACNQRFAGDNCRLLGMNEVAAFSVYSRGSKASAYMARIMVRDPALYMKERVSPEGVRILEEQRTNLQQLLDKDPKDRDLEARRRAEREAVKQAEHAAASGKRVSVRLRTEVIQKQLVL